MQNLQWFADEIDKANEIKRAAQTGQTQIGEFILSGAVNENGLFRVDSIHLRATAYPEAKKPDDASRPALDQLPASQGMQPLYTVPWPGQSPCNKKPLTRLADIKGNKMPAYNPATDRIAELIGAHPRREPAKLAARVQFRAHAPDLAGPTP